MPPLAPARASNKEDFGSGSKGWSAAAENNVHPGFYTSRPFDCHPERGVFCRTKDLGSHRAQSREKRDFNKARGDLPYFDTAANKSECSSDWNCLSSALKCICKSEPSEFTSTFCSATFSIGVAVILR
jgi:hypothetical protein